MNILIVAPYFGGSHRSWAEGYAQHSTHCIDLLTLPARFWKWRMQGGAVTLAEQARRLNRRPDLLLVTDMLNLPVFLGLTRDVYADVPVVMYCHENQLTYPVPPGEKRDLTYGMINWLSMLAADHVLFNSRHHWEAWFDELPRLLKHFPDHTHMHHVPQLQARAQVLPVGCDLSRFDHTRGVVQKGRLPLVLWNQRWEYDKDPVTFFRALDILAAEGLDFQVALAGSNVRQMPEEFEAARERLGERVVHYGRADADGYRDLLCRADIVVSTAIHEFFGIAIVEAIYGGCFPILPRRLAYPEVLPVDYHADCLYDEFSELVDQLRWAVLHLGQARTIAVQMRPAMAQYDWAEMAPRYDETMERVALMYR
jgi:glycosyltransferase involved in cell wall biosynthesis